MAMAPESGPSGALGRGKNVIVLLAKNRIIIGDGPNCSSERWEPSRERESRRAQCNAVSERERKKKM